MVAVLGTEEKGYVAQRCNLEQLVFPSILTAFHPRLSIPSLPFPGSLSVYIGYNEQLFLETRRASWLVPEKKVKEIIARLHRSVHHRRGLKAGLYVRLEISSRALDPISPSATWYIAKQRFPSSRLAYSPRLLLFFFSPSISRLSFSFAITQGSVCVQAKLSAAVASLL